MNTEPYTPSLCERVMDTLAYYECRRVNPKADDPRVGYHAFAEDQRVHLREAHREAAEEIARMIEVVRAEGREKALLEAADAYENDKDGPYFPSIVSRWLRERADRIRAQGNGQA